MGTFSQIVKLWFLNIWVNLLGVTYKDLSNGGGYGVCTIYITMFDPKTESNDINYNQANLDKDFPGLKPKNPKKDQFIYGYWWPDASRSTTHFMHFWHRHVALTIYIIKIAYERATKKIFNR